MIGVEVKVYGSVCVGLAARDSDVDVTVGEGILEQGWGYLEDISDRISGFFEYLQYYFANYPWISNIKVIKSATIPIIKFTIDTTHLNPTLTSVPLGTVQIDLTIETTQPPRKHLGIISTRQTQ